MTTKKLFIFINPEFHRRFCNGLNLIYRILHIENGYNLEFITKEYLKEPVNEENISRKLVIIGGDGTVHIVINTIPQDSLDKYVFGIIPAGTANEFAKSLSIPIDIEEATRIIAKPKMLQTEHLGVINNEILFATGVMFGVASKVLQLTPRIAKHFLGRAAFQLGFLRFFTEYLSPWKGWIKNFKVNSRAFRTNYLLINNASLISKGIASFKENEPDLFLIYIHSRLRLPDIIRILLKHHMHYKVLYDPALYFEQLKEIFLEFDEEMGFLIDGDPYKLAPPISIKIADQQIRIITG